mmetsp:Transcript_15369/g.46347  ORF Transcript_15369/g.46347 Transcript_15369/m.46347 type:complete len:410 (+) Transcript_15369:85-1314(+)
MGMDAESDLGAVAKTAAAAFVAAVALRAWRGLGRRRRRRSEEDARAATEAATAFRRLTEAELEHFRERGYVVVEGVLDAAEVDAARAALGETLRRYGGVELDDLAGTARGLAALSSTRGLGGVLDLFYQPWKLRIQTNARLFSAMSQLWEATYASGEEPHFEHPYGAFDASRGYIQIDRVCVRVPTEISDALADGGSRKKRGKGLQRALHPHLDCCPHRLYDPPKNSWKTDEANHCTKWRPIQCFVALSDATEPSSGGFECAGGYHRNFQAWAQRRNQPEKLKEGGAAATSVCMGDFTPLIPNNPADGAALDEFRYVPAKKGAAVFWDWRIPHASERVNDTDRPRLVVYCGLLPATAQNEAYALEQRGLYEQRRPPSDFWTLEKSMREADEPPAELTPLGRRLLAQDPW